MAQRYSIPHIVPRAKKIIAALKIVELVMDKLDPSIAVRPYSTGHHNSMSISTRRMRVIVQAMQTARDVTSWFTSPRHCNVSNNFSALDSMGDNNKDRLVEFFHGFPQNTGRLKGLVWCTCARSDVSVGPSWQMEDLLNCMMFK